MSPSNPSAPDALPATPGGEPPAYAIVMVEVTATRSALAAATHPAFTPRDAVMAMQLWNKVLAFRTAFAEAVALQWRVELCHDVDGAEFGVRLDPDTRALAAVESNDDPLAAALGPCVHDLPELATAFIDAAVRASCPHTQTVQREAYRADTDAVLVARANGSGSALDLSSVSDYCRLFAAAAPPPRTAVALVRAVLWATQTHAPYAQQDDHDDLAAGLESALGRVVAQTAAEPLLAAIAARAERMVSAAFCEHLPSVWGAFSDVDRANFAENFYRGLLGKYPDMLSYFSSSDMDSLALHLADALNAIVRSPLVGTANPTFRAMLHRLGVVHRHNSIPTYTYPLLGTELISAFDTHWKKAAAASGGKLTVEGLRSTFVALYTDVVAVVHYPMRRQEQLLASAQDFFEKVAVELDWSDLQLEERMLRVETEVHGTGTYTHTSAELEIGARLAWRNSAKCIGRISWNTLQVRDCRHIDDPQGIFNEVCTHLREATAGTNIQSVMTVFRPKADNEPLGTRFWSSQFTRYAGYKDPVTGAVMGEPSSVDLTDYLLKNNLWTPPEPRTPFDVLPLVLKRPGRRTPDIFTLPDDLVHEVEIEHPSKPAISKLGYRWSTVPAISNFKMTLGGITYQNIPFNGWFMSTEIVRNLMERFGADVAVADALGVDRQGDPVWRQQVALELERAVLYSFKKNGYTIVDPTTVGQSFCTHVQREREQHARECPGQWSWIGGLVGPTNPTWHLEMRDFLVNPQYDYCVDGQVLHCAFEHEADDTDGETVSSFDTDGSMPEIEVPRPLILYGSETGNAESTARMLKRELRQIKPVLKSLNEVSGLGIAKKLKITHVLCVCSTFGNGQAPSNARSFFENPIEKLGDVKFAVLGLGSTMYPDFCKAGVTLDKKLKAAELTQLCPLVKADEAKGAEKTVTEWITLVKSLVLKPNIEKVLATRAELGQEKKIVHEIKWLGEAQKGNGTEGHEPAGSLCLSNDELLEQSGKISKSVRRIVFEAPSPYVTGDHLAVRPLNSETRVNQFLRLFARELCTSFETEAAGDEIVELASDQLIELECVEGVERDPADVFFDMPARLGDLLTSKLDLSLDEKSLKDVLLLIKAQLEGLFETVSPSVKEYLQSNSQVKDMLQYCASVSGKPSAETSAAADEILASFPSINLLLLHFTDLLFSPIADPNGAAVQDCPLLKLGELLAVMPRLQQRYYSISSSSTSSPDEITITVGVLHSTTSKGATIDGVCSNYLASLKPSTGRASITVHTSLFRLAREPSAPLIMVGAGTGLSPLMGFLDDRARLQREGAGVGTCDLFFGCRTTADFIYEREIGSYAGDGVATLHLALSRPAEGCKAYVQDRIADKQDQMCELLLRDDAHYYVCGDVRMAESCFESCVNVLRKGAKMSRVLAVRHLRRMRMEGRWQTDVWGIVSNFEESKRAIEKSRREAAQKWLSTFGEEA